MPAQIEHDRRKPRLGDGLGDARLDPIELRIGEKAVQHDNGPAPALDAVGEALAVEAFEACL
jgi:hypothetical protein